MNPIGLVQSPAVAPTPAATQLELQIRNVLAGSRRLWLRARRTGVPAPPSRPRPWFGLRKGGDPPAPVPIQLETYVSGKELRAELPAPSGGEREVDVTFEVELPA